MPTITMFLCSALILFFSLKVNGQTCNLSNIELLITNTGKKFGSDPIFVVKVKNSCACPLINVHLSCEGFASSMYVNPKVFRPDNDGCLVNDGKGIPPLASFEFQYAYDRGFSIAPSSFEVAC